MRRGNSWIYLALVIVLATSAGCPGSCAHQPDDGGGGIVTIVPATLCGEATSLLEEGRFDEAVDALREQMVTEPAFGTEPRADLCLGRALLGAGENRRALALLGPLFDEPNVDAAVQRASCLYATWAKVATGDLEASGQLLLSCEPRRKLTVQDVILEDDTVGAALALIGARSSLGLLASCAELADWLLIEQPDDITSRRWVYHVLFDAARAGGPQGLEPLADGDSPVGRALAAYAQLSEDVATDNWDHINAELDATRVALYGASADEALLAVEDWVAVQDFARPPVFGAVVSLSGVHRPSGRAVLAGMLLAQGVFESSSEPSSLEPSLSPSRLIIRDAGESAESAADAVAELDQLGVLAIIGPSQPELAEGAIREATDRRVPIVSLARTEPLAESLAPATQGSERNWSFAFYPDPVQEAESLIELARTEGLWELALVMPSRTSDYLERFVEAFEEGADREGLRIVAREMYGVDDMQAEADRVADRLSTQAFSGLLIADTPDNASTIAAYLAVRDVWGRGVGESPPEGRRYIVYFGNSSWHDPEFLRAGPSYLAGGVFAAWLPLELEVEATVRFVERFEAAFSRRPGPLGAFAHDALSLLRTIVIDSGAGTRTSLRNALEAGESVDGATGTVQFGADGERQDNPVLLQIRAGGFQPL